MEDMKDVEGVGQPPKLPCYGSTFDFYLRHIMEPNGNRLREVKFVF